MTSFHKTVTAAAQLITMVLCADLSAQHHAIWRFDGQSANASLGISVGAGSDVDGDGFADVIVGAYGESLGNIGSGVVRVLSGRTAAVVFTFPGESANDRLGNAVAFAGDVDADGIPDIVAGASARNMYTGAAFVYSGRTGSILFRISGTGVSYALGYSVAGAGDVDGDGYDDVVVGGLGEAIVLSGRNGAIIYSFRGPTALGNSVAGAGDINADGFDDIIVGSRGNFAHVHSGRDGSLLYTFTGDLPGDGLGDSTASAGDVDLDGFADVIVGTFLVNSGYARVFSGRTGLPLFTFRGDPLARFFGSSVADAGDVDGDHHHDFIIGAQSSNYTGLDQGACFVFSGADGHLIARLVGESAFDHFGFSVAGGGDANGDGFADVVIGAVQTSYGASEGGSVYLWSMGFIGTPPRIRSVGSGCSGSNLHRPRIAIESAPFVGGVFRVRLRGALPTRAVLLNIGIPSNVDLTSAGLPGCRLLASVDMFNIPSFTDPYGLARTGGIPVPTDGSLIGVRLAAQWVCLDSSANSVGVTLSNAIDFVIGS